MSVDIKKSGVWTSGRIIENLENNTPKILERSYEDANQVITEKELILQADNFYEI